jgi:AcrR family transcriptional regulator
MSIVVEHDKRRRQILRKALAVFMKEGYENATYQKIADHCKITRTTLYLYFRNRQEIFNFSIKQFMGEIEQDILGVKEDRSLSSPAKLKKTLLLILSRLEENRPLLSVIFNYIFFKSEKTNSAVTAYDRVRRRTIRLRHILSAMIIEGIKKGELKKIDVGAANDLLYGLLESAIFRLTALKRESTAELKEAIELAVSGFEAM